MNPYGGYPPNMPPPYMQQGMPPPFLNRPPPGMPQGMVPPYMGPPMVPPMMGPQAGMPFPPRPMGVPPSATLGVISAAPTLVTSNKPPVITPVTSVYVGKIPPGVEDEFVRKLLELCGKVVNWKRMADPETGKLKGFGFCEYEHPEGASRAVRILSNLKLDESNLLVRVDEKTQKMLDDYNKSKEGSSTVVEEKKERENEDERIRDLIRQLNLKRERGEDYRRISNDDIKKGSRDDRRDRRAEEEERRLRIEKERERERELRRKEREEREYREMEHDWENRERVKFYEREKMRERERRERERAARDLEYDDYERKRATKEYYRKRREREKEREEDDIDRLREMEENRAKIPPPSPAPMESEPTPPPPPEVPTYDDEDEQQVEQMLQESQEVVLERTKISSIVLAAPPKEKKPTVVTASGFGREEEQDDLFTKKKRKLVTLENPLHEDDDKKAKMDHLRSLIETIPTEKEPLFAYSLNWELLDQGDVVEKKMRPWVTKKIIEYLGQEEKTLIDFILSKIREHVAANDLVEQLKLILDEEATAFVIKLW